MPIQPIETTYANHRFRSRLEARYAVLFDSLGIRWEYEPQGYLVGPDRKPYLPDFWLPGENLWVEVKGSEDQLDIELLVHAALPTNGLPRPSEPPVVNEYEVRMLILGPLGRGVQRVEDRTTKEHVGYTQPVHSALAFRKGDLVQGTAYFSEDGVITDPEGGRVANDGPHIFWDGRGTAWGNLVGGGLLISEAYNEAVAGAYHSAISARFEHGQQGR